MKYSSSSRRAGFRGQFEIGREIFYSLLKTSQIHCPCHDWDDFWDFSRMAIPKDNWSLRKRLWGNILKQFCGNYLCIWTLVMIMVGIVVHQKIFLSLLVLVLSWTLLSMMNTRGLYREKPPLSIDEMVRSEEL